MQTDEPAVAHAHLRERAEPKAIGEARRWITAFAAEYAMPAAQQEDLAAAVSEAVTNAVRHAYPPDAIGDVVLTAATDGEWMTVQVKDRGCGTESSSLGLGLLLMAELSDRMEVNPGRDGMGTEVLMEFPSGRVADERRSARRPTASPAMSLLGTADAQGDEIAPATSSVSLP